MVRLGAIEITLAPDSSDPPTYIELSPEHSINTSLWQGSDPLTFREYPDPNYAASSSPYTSSVSTYIEVTYGRGFRIDITLHPGFNFCGWDRVRYDIFVEGCEKGFVLSKREHYESYGNKTKLRIGGLPMWFEPINGGQGRKKKVNGGSRVVGLRFNDPGQHLSEYGANAGTVIVEIRLCNDHNGQLISSNALCSFTFRYRNRQDLIATRALKHVLDTQIATSGHGDALELQKLSSRPYRALPGVSEGQVDEVTLVGNDSDAGVDPMEVVAAGAKIKRRQDVLESGLPSPPAKKKPTTNGLVDGFHVNTPELSLLQDLNSIREVDEHHIDDPDSITKTANPTNCAHHQHLNNPNHTPASVTDPFTTRKQHVTCKSQKNAGVQNGTPQTLAKDPAHEQNKDVAPNSLNPPKSPIQPIQTSVSPPTDIFSIKAEAFLHNLHRFKLEIPSNPRDSIQVETQKGQRRTRILLIEREFTELVSEQGATTTLNDTATRDGMQSRFHRGKQRYIELELHGLEQEITMGEDISEAAAGAAASGAALWEPGQLWNRGTALVAIKALRAEFQALVEYQARSGWTQSGDVDLDREQGAAAVGLKG